MAGKKKGSDVDELVQLMRASGIKAQDLRKMMAASKTGPQTARIKKSRSKLEAAKRAKARFERSPEGLLGKVSKIASKRKRKKR